jgi:uncharacterized peroxidase-related enzyme
MAAPTAPEAQPDVHARAEEMFGMVPNLITEMADHTPAVADAYLQANRSIDKGDLTPAERQAVILAISSYNDCHYCTKAHAMAGKAAGLDADTVETINAGGLPYDERLKALVQAARRVIGKRGWLSDDDRADLEACGIDRGALYEIVGLVGIKTISNFVNHIAGTEVDAAFQ